MLPSEPRGTFLTRTPVDKAEKALHQGVEMDAECGLKEKADAFKIYADQKIRGNVPSIFLPHRAGRYTQIETPRL